VEGGRKYFNLHSIVLIFTDDDDVKKFSVACDGSHIYLLTANGLYKIGNGFGGTTSGRVYQHNPKLTSKGTLLYINVSFIFSNNLINQSILYELWQSFKIFFSILFRE